MDCYWVAKGHPHQSQERREHLPKPWAPKNKNEMRRKLGGSQRKVAQLIPYGEGDVLAIDFVFEYTENGRRLKVFTMVAEKTRVSPSVMVPHSIKGTDLGPFIELVCEKLLKVIRVDQVTEYTSRALLEWTHKNGIQLEFTRVRKPNQLIEFFYSRFILFSNANRGRLSKAANKKDSNHQPPQICWIRS